MKSALRRWARFRFVTLPLLIALAAAETVLEAQTPGPRGPDTTEEKRIAAFLAAFDSGTEAAIREFVEKNFSPKDLERMPVEPRVRRLSRFAREISPLVLQKTLPRTREGPALLVRSKKTGRWYEVRLELTRDPAREILGVDIEETDSSAAEPEPVFRSDEEIARAARAYLERLARDGRFSGVALLARDGKPFFREAHGMADRERKIANTPSTKFNIGSINKAFTQVAVAQLASTGRLSLSDTVRKLLPEYLSLSASASPPPAVGEITIAQLINMTSGLGDIFNERYSEAAPRLMTLADFARLFADKPLLFPPGKGREYSNAGYIVLGLVVERVSGQSYHDYVREHVFAPAGMRSSGPSERSIVAADRAIGYTREDSAPAAEGAERALRPNTDSLPARSSSAGGGLSTVEDLLAFDLALRAGTLLPPAWTAWIFSDKTAPPSPADRPCERAGLGVAGGTPGANAVLESDGWSTIIILANLDPPIAERTAAKFRGWMERVEEPRAR